MGELEGHVDSVTMNFNFYKLCGYAHNMAHVMENKSTRCEDEMTNYMSVLAHFAPSYDRLLITGLNERKTDGNVYFTASNVEGRIKQQQKFNDSKSTAMH